MIAICGKQMYVEVTKGLIDACYKLTQHYIPYEVKFFSQYGLERERNMAVRTFLKSKHSHLFFLDTDVVLKPDTLSTLLIASKDHFIISGMYILNKDLNAVANVKISPRTWKFVSFEKLYKPWISKIVEIDGAGAGCLLIDRVVLETVKQPWFKFYGIYGEDLHFCDKAKKAGFQTYLHMDVKVTHIKCQELII